MTTYPLAWPTHTGVTGAKIRRDKGSSANTSPHSGVQQIYELQKDVLEFDLSFPLMSRAQADIWEAWLWSMDGLVGTALVPPLDGEPTGSARAEPGTPQANAATAARSKTLVIKTGLSGNRLAYLKIGNWFSLSTGATRRLHRIVDSDVDLVSGNATMNFRPPLREAVAENATIYVANPTGRFRLASPITETDIDLALHRRIGTIGFKEDL